MRIPRGLRLTEGIVFHPDMVRELVPKAKEEENKERKNKGGNVDDKTKFRQSV
jgi:hypothetical protein